MPLAILHMSLFDDYVAEAASHALKVNNPRHCERCNKPYQIDVGFAMCETCGEVRDITLDDEDHAAGRFYHNTQAGAYIAIKLHGPGGARCRRSLLQTCSDTSVCRNNAESRILANVAFQQCEVIPKVAFKLALGTLFIAIRRVCPGLRGALKKGIIAACIEIACIDFGTPVHEDEIMKILNIGPNELTLGEQRIIEMHNIGLIEFTIKANVNRFVAREIADLIRVDDKVIDAMSDFLAASDDRRLIPEANCSHMSTMLVGAIVHVKLSDPQYNLPPIDSLIAILRSKKRRISYSQIKTVVAALVAEAHLYANVFGSDKDSIATVCAQIRK